MSLAALNSLASGEWSMPADGWHSHCMVIFENALPGVLPVLTGGVCYDAIAANGRHIPFPEKLLSKIRRHKAEQNAAEAANSSGCPCKLRGYEGETNGQDITWETKMIFEWCAIRTIAGQPYTVQILYYNLVLAQESSTEVPNAPGRSPWACLRR